jgi:hypothetical protein
MHYAGIKGDFGTIRRPTAHGSSPSTARGALHLRAREAGQVLCNDVDNWFAVKITRSR